MSTLAFLLVLTGADPYAPPGDEGPKAHIFQLLLVCQLPITALAIATRRSLVWVKTLKEIGLQVLFWALPLAGLVILIPAGK